jgi:hypothetical protein
VCADVAPRSLRAHAVQGMQCIQVVQVLQQQTCSKQADKVLVKSQCSLEACIIKHIGQTAS